MMTISFKTTTKKIFEPILVLALVLLFFMVILLTLNTVFPTGQSLLDLVSPGGQGPSHSGDYLTSRNLRLSTGTGEYGLGDRSNITAVLSDLENLVKSKRANQIAWQGAPKGMTFFNSDAIQTFHKSSATLSIKKGNILELGENSLVVLRKLERDVFTRENRTIVVLMGGQLSGEVRKTDQENYNLEIIAPGVIARAPSKDNKDKPTRFQMAVKPDNSSILTVLEGTADLMVDGETIKVGADQVVQVQPGKRPVFLGPPPEPPVLASPADDEMFPFRDVPPIVTFGWSASEDIQGYNFVLATDSQFKDILHEGRIDGNQFTHGNLKPGDYFWRISSVNKNGEGNFSRVKHFQLIQDLEPPALEVNYPDTGEVGDKFVLRGRTDPDARIFVGGIPVEIDEGGEFVHNLFLQRGFNVIVVEAVDKVGNVAYFSQLVNVEF
jgi:mannose-6-phosphate isomerase-like protein (cupin superfamily)